LSLVYPVRFLRSFQVKKSIIKWQKNLKYRKQNFRIIVRKQKEQTIKGVMMGCQNVDRGAFVPSQKTGMMRDGMGLLGARGLRMESVEGLGVRLERSFVATARNSMIKVGWGSDRRVCRGWRVGGRIGDRVGGVCRARGREESTCWSERHRYWCWTR
jgi:hypothetical protein